MNEQETKINPRLGGGEPMANGSSFTAQVRIIAIAGAAAIAGSTAINYTSPDVRADPFTKSMGIALENDTQRKLDALREQVLETVRQRSIVDHIVLRAEMEASIPPPEVAESLRTLKARVRKLEDVARTIDPTFRPQWGE